MRESLAMAAPRTVQKIVSGGQTGVDRAALGVALELGMPCGGWCPKGRRAEDGTIPEVYPLRETPTSFYPQRTEWNVRDSDGTLVLAPGKPRGGTALTLRLARRLSRPSLTVDLDRPVDPEAVRAWISESGIRVLNVAGPRETENAGVHDRARRFLLGVLAPGLVSERACSP